MFAAFSQTLVVEYVLFEIASTVRRGFSLLRWRPGIGLEMKRLVIFAAGGARMWIGKLSGKLGCRDTKR